MSTTASEALRKTTHQKLSKYTSPQLVSKLEGNTLMGLSKEVAIEILDKRKIDTSKYKPQTYNKATSSKLEHSSSEEKASKVEKSTKTPKAKVTKEPKAPKTPKTPKEKKPATPLIDETDPQVKAILETELMKKTDKIAALLGLGYTCTQISKSSLKAHYSFCHSVMKSLKKGE